MQDLLQLGELQRARGAHEGARGPGHEDALRDAQTPRVQVPDRRHLPRREREVRETVLPGKIKLMKNFQESRL